MASILTPIFNLLSIPYLIFLICQSVIYGRRCGFFTGLGLFLLGSGLGITLLAWIATGRFQIHYMTWFGLGCFLLPNFL